LQHIPVLDDLAINIEAENVNASDFVAKQIQVAHMNECQVAVDRDPFYLAGNAPHLLEKAHDAVDPVLNQRIVLDVWPGHECRK